MLKLLHPNKDLAFRAIETRPNNFLFTFSMKRLCYWYLSVFATAKWLLSSWLVLWKIIDAVLVCYPARVPKPDYVVVCFHSLPPTPVSRGQARNQLGTPGVAKSFLRGA